MRQRLSPKCASSLNKLKNSPREANDTKAEVDAILLTIPNMPEATTPVGGGEEDNIEIKTWGELPGFDFDLKPALGNR